MIHTKEFYDIMRAFEITAKNFDRVGNFDRCDKDMWEHKQYYNNGETNRSFVCFLNGYMAGRLSYLN